MLVAYLLLFSFIGAQADIRLLHEAINNFDTHSAVQQVQSGTNLGPVNGHNSMTALHLATYKGNLEVVQAILQKTSDHINKFRTPLHYALHGLHELNHQPTKSNAASKATQYLEIIRLLINNRAKPYQRDERGRNALHLALQFGLTSIIDSLASDKSCTASAGSGSTPVDMVSDQNYKHWNVFHFAGYTRYRWKMISNLLLKEAKSKDDFTIFRSYFSHVWSKEYETLNRGSLDDFVVHRKDTWDPVALHSRELIEQLISSCSAYDLDYSTLLLSFTEQQMTPYHMAVDTGDADMLQYLLTTFPKVWDEANGIEVPLKTLLHVASLRGHENCIDILTKYYNICFYDEYNRVPSQVWHLQSSVPASLVAWEAKFCFEAIPADIKSQETREMGFHSNGETDCTIDVVDGHHLSPIEFKKNYLSIRKPVLVKNAVSSWSATKKWSTDYFSRNHGHLQAWMGEIPYAPQFNLPGKRGTLSHYARYVSMVENNQIPPMMKDKPIMYVFDNEVLTSPEGKKLFEDIEIPTIVENYSWNGAQFMWGPPGSGAPLHHHKDAWNGLAFGEKKWWFYPPAFSVSSTSLSSNWDSPYFCKQTAGDVMYVPDSWSHAVYNNQFSSAVAIEFTP